MSALPLFDAIVPADRGSPVPARVLRVAEQLTRDALDSLKQIESLDTDLAEGETTDYDPKLARVFRGMYEDWARDAEAVLERVERLPSKVPGVQELGDRYGRVRAMLSVSLEEIEAALEDVRAGRTYTLEEVRRELRLGNRE